MSSSQATRSLVNLFTLFIALKGKYKKLALYHALNLFFLLQVPSLFLLVTHMFHIV